MKKVFALLIAVMAFSFLYACGEEPQLTNNQETVMPNNWDGEWVFSILGEPSDDFDEFKLYISGETISVKQGDIFLWAGSFNPMMPLDQTFTIKSTRMAGVNLVYTPTNVTEREFHYEDGKLTYSEGDDGELEFVKAK